MSARYGAMGGWRRAVAVGLPAILVAVLGATTQWLRVAGRTSNAAVTTATAITDHLDGMLERLTGVESADRAYLLTGDEQYLKPSRGAGTAVERDLDSLRALTADDSLQSRRITLMQRLADSRLREIATITDAAPTGDQVAVARSVAVSDGHNTMDSLRSAIALVRTDEEQRIQRSSAELARRRVTLNIVVTAGTSLAVLVALFVNALLTNYAQDRERSATLLATQAQELERHNAALRMQAADLASANRDLESTTARLQATAAELETTGVERERARQVAETANRAKSDFLATMSHELRTPLNAIVGYAALLEEGVRGPLSSEQATDLARIRRASRHLLGLINDVLNFARLDAGQVHVDHVPVPIDETLAAATNMLEGQARTKGVGLIRTPCDRAIAALGDQEKLLQIVVNLLSNAVKFTDAAGRIEMTCVEERDVLQITVSDTGRGIAVEHLSRIFEPFVQIARDPASEGVGLGLAISRDLARAMGGDLTVRSEEGRGSAFTLQLPRARGAMPRRDGAGAGPPPPRAATGRGGANREIPAGDAVLPSPSRTGPLTVRRPEP